MLLVQKARHYVEHYAMNEAEKILVTELADEIERLHKEEITLAESRLLIRQLSERVSR